MPINILFTYGCSLKCDYCFEKDHWNTKGVLSPQELIEILKFIGPGRDISILGGEPTQNPHFQKLCEILQACPGNKYLSTNGLFLQEFRDIIDRTFALTLFNINSPNTYAETSWDILENNLNYLCQEERRTKVQIGVVAHKKGQRYEYLIPMMQYLNILKEIRLSVAYPAPGFSNTHLKLNDIKALKDDIIQLIAMVRAYNFIIRFDEPIPGCVFDMDEMLLLQQHTRDFNHGGCAGTYLLLPRLKVGHCFSSYEDQYNLQDFRSIEHIEQFMYTKEVGLMYEKYAFKECKNCFLRQNKACQGGCLGFKIKKEKVLKAKRAKEKSGKSEGSHKKQG